MFNRQEHITEEAQLLCSVCNCKVDCISSLYAHQRDLHTTSQLSLALLNALGLTTSMPPNDQQQTFTSTSADYFDKPVDYSTKYYYNSDVLENRLQDYCNDSILQNVNSLQKENTIDYHYENTTTNCQEVTNENFIWNNNSLTSFYNNRAAFNDQYEVALSLLDIHNTEPCYIDPKPKHTNQSCSINFENSKMKDMSSEEINYHTQPIQQQELSSTSMAAIPILGSKRVLRKRSFQVKYYERREPVFKRSRRKPACNSDYQNVALNVPTPNNDIKDCSESGKDFTEINEILQESVDVNKEFNVQDYPNLLKAFTDSPVETKEISVKAKVKNQTPCTSKSENLAKPRRLFKFNPKHTSTSSTKNGFNEVFCEYIEQDAIRQNQRREQPFLKRRNAMYLNSTPKSEVNVERLQNFNLAFQKKSALTGLHFPLISPVNTTPIFSTSCNNNYNGNNTPSYSFPHRYVYQNNNVANNSYTSANCDEMKSVNGQPCVYFDYGVSSNETNIHNYTEENAEAHVQQPYNALSFIPPNRYDVYTYNTNPTFVSNENIMNITMKDVELSSNEHPEPNTNPFWETNMNKYFPSETDSSSEVEFILANDIPLQENTHSSIMVASNHSYCVPTWSHQYNTDYKWTEMNSAYKYSANCEKCGYGYKNKDLLATHNKYCAGGYQTTFSETESILDNHINKWQNLKNNLRIPIQQNESVTTRAMNRKKCPIKKSMNSKTRRTGGGKRMYRSNASRQQKSKYLCVDCSNKFTNRTAYCKHVLMCTKARNKPLACDKCNVKVATKRQLYLHIKSCRMHINTSYHKCADDVYCIMEEGLLCYKCGII